MDIQQTNEFLVKESPGKLMRKYAIPCIISLLVAALYNIVDQIFIGWGVGMEGNGATNTVFPLTVLALAVAPMIGDGACSFVSISLGRKDADSAHRSVGNAIVLTLASSLALMAVYLAFRDPILYLFGANDEVSELTRTYAKDYFQWIAIGVPFYMFGQGMNPIIRSDGSPRVAMIATLAGAVANIILDPIACQRQLENVDFRRNGMSFFDISCSAKNYKIAPALTAALQKKKKNYLSCFLCVIVLLSK